MATVMRNIEKLMFLSVSSEIWFEVLSSVHLLNLFKLRLRETTRPKA